MVKSLVAIDIDEKMVAAAKEKLKKVQLKNIRVMNSRIEDLTEDGFDLAVAMFNVVTYIPDTKSLLSFVKAVAKRLKPGGIFVFDCWNGAAAIKDPPKVKKSLLTFGNKKITYTLTPDIDFYNQKVTMNYEIEVSSKSFSEVGGYSFNQTLWMPREIEAAILNAGLEIVLVSPTMHPDALVSEKDWKIMFCVRKPR